MLPAGCGGRSAAALAAALGEGAERQQELEQRAARSRALLRRWDSEEEEQSQAEAGSSSGQENRPSPKELEELELLNRALEKALKVRKSISKYPLEAQEATGEKSAGEGPAPKNAEEQQIPVPVQDVPESTKGPRTAGNSSSKGVSCKQGRSHRTAISDTEVCASAEPQKTSGLSKSAPNEQQNFSIGDSAGGHNSVAAVKQLCDAGKKHCGFLGESSKQEDPAMEGVLGRGTSPQTVTVQGKRCQLKLPLPYRKAYSRNSRAWEKCHLCQTSADAAAARNRFIERIQTTFCSPMPAFSPAEIEEELKVLQDVPSLLSQYVEAEPADHPTLQREYESLLTLEGLQTIVSQCLHKLQLLQAAVESQVGLCPDCTGDLGSCSPACVPPRGQMCDSAGVLAVPLLWYSSFQELSDLFALKLQVSMLHQEIALQKVMMAELLPVLEAGLHPEASAAQLYRAIYTQLCEGGKRFPVLVRDELAD
ncbi:tubulin epsilon and delta complex protein 2 isoform X3 [Athene noctua]|uniref:tubulin epsilon and delta complex protein 2 isoform X3 n=1 Tax=Athene noctua TaxID=126797 RepID=UPI003EBF38FD